MNLLGTMSVSAGTLTAVACDLSLSLARTGFRFVALVSTHGGNRGALDEAVRSMSMDRCVVCAPPGDLGPAPGSYQASELTSVMLAVRPDLVDLGAVSQELQSEVAAASGRHGHEHFERFVASCVKAVLALRGEGRQASP